MKTYFLCLKHKNIINKIQLFANEGVGSVFLVVQL